MVSVNALLDRGPGSLHDTLTHVVSVCRSLADSLAEGAGIVGDVDRVLGQQLNRHDLEGVLVHRGMLAAHVIDEGLDALRVAAGGLECVPHAHPHLRLLREFGEDPGEHIDRKVLLSDVVVSPPDGVSVLGQQYLNIVALTLSPVLWKKVMPKLSAGRVQSVATRIVVEREREIRAFNPEEYWEIHADLGTAKGANVRFEVARENGEAFKPLNEAQAMAALDSGHRAPPAVETFRSLGYRYAALI